ncbi:MAG TPA: electron transfer flavoprotein subunit beta/FixA family protein [Trebonia sp.]
MEILVCVKRVPTVGGAITLTAGDQAVDTTASGFTISPHEECAVEEAVRLVERFGGSVTVVSLGPAAAQEQLRACLALGASAAVLVETADGTETGPVATAAALHAVAADGHFDLVLLGNEASDTGGYQVGIRLAHLLGQPVATGIKSLTASGDGSSLSASRTYRGVVETFALPLPCLVTVKEGINLPRYPSLPGRLRAKRAVIRHIPFAEAVPGPAAPDVSMTRLRVTDAPRKQAAVLGTGTDAVPALVAVLAELGVIA